MLYSNNEDDSNNNNNNNNNNYKKKKKKEVVRAHEIEKIRKNRKSIFKDANRYTAEYNLTCEFNNTNTVFKDIDGKTTQTNPQSPHAIKDLLRQALQKKYIENNKEQAWLSALMTKQLEDPYMRPNTNQVFRKWKNIPDIVYSVNKDISHNSYQQEVINRQNYKHKSQIRNAERATLMQIETKSHILSGCSRIAQSLYKARHDRMLWPIYHHLLQKSSQLPRE